ncbi:MAG TPA: helix-turn-helix transcriptional regulator [Puia sp.]|jgi:ribosomal protein S30
MKRKAKLPDKGRQEDLSKTKITKNQGSSPIVSDQVNPIRICYPYGPYKLTKTGKVRKQLPRGKDRAGGGPQSPRKKDYRTIENSGSNDSRIYNTNMDGGADFLLAFGKKLYEWRLSKELSVRPFGELIKIDNSKITKIENGKLNITMLTFYQIICALELSPEQFWGKIKKRKRKIK